MYVHGHYGHLSIITCHSFNLLSLWFRHRGNCSEAFRPSLAPSCIQLLLGPHLWDPLLTMPEGRGHLQAKNNIWIILAKVGSSVWIIFCHSKCSNWMNAWSIYQRISRWTKSILAALWLDLIRERMLNFQQPCWRWTILLHPAYGMERTGVSTTEETPKRGNMVSCNTSDSPCTLIPQPELTKFTARSLANSSNLANLNLGPSDPVAEDGQRDVPSWGPLWNPSLLF